MRLLDVEDLEPFKDEAVNLKCRDMYNSSQVWFYYGIIRKITPDTVKLQYLKKEGFTYVNIDRILSVEKRGRERFDY